MMPSAACRPIRTIGWIVVPSGREVEDPLEEPPGVAGPGRALGQRHALGHLDDPERGQLPGPRLEQGGADADQLLRGQRVRDRDEDPAGSGDFAVMPALRPGPAASQRSTRYGLSSSNSRACRSTRSSAWSVVTWRFSMTKLPTRPK